MCENTNENPEMTLDVEDESTNEGFEMTSDEKDESANENPEISLDIKAENENTDLEVTSDIKVESTNESSEASLHVVDEKMKSYVKNAMSDSYNVELESDERYGKCHSKSLELVLITPNSKIVTGYITENNLHLLHSIIVSTELNGDYVYDWTKNLIMSKDEYYKLNKFKVLSEITKDEIIYDKENYEDLLVNNICIKPYLVFRNEIVKEIETKKYIKHL